VYFPRLTIPISAILSGTVDFTLSFALLVGMLLYYHITLSLTVVWIPLFFLLAVTTALGAGLWLSALNVEYRDVRYVIPFLTQLWMFATPIAYPSSLLREPWRSLFGVNPMTGVTEGFRWALLGAHTHPTGMLFVSALTATAMLVGGAFYFRKMESTFADII
jgi:lipopolysaccharide transport system permease protein